MTIRHDQYSYYTYTLFITARDTPLKLKVNIPSVLRQRGGTPFPLRVKGRLNEEVEGPITVRVGIEKEFFKDFWTTIPCVSLGYENWSVIKL